jgi:hypothetical protein
VLRVQQYLGDGNPLDGLTAELGVGVYRHPHLPLIGLKYQAHSPKAHPIVRECRGLVLEDGSWDVVAKPFDRFFNAAEDPDALAAFRWSRCWCQSKEDGALAIAYAYRGAWHVNTSGSFGLAKVGFSGRTWTQLLREASGVEPARLDPARTYVFELCSPYTKVVRAYPRPVAYLLAMFDPATCRELPVEAADDEASRLGLRRPEQYRLSSMSEVAEFLAGKERDDPTFEGVILRDDAGLRLKVKTRTYLAAHHAEGPGNLFHPRRLAPLILSGEIDEVAAYHPEIREAAEAVRSRLEAAWETLRAVWERARHVEDQKEFARAVVGATPFSGLLFTLRKEHGPGGDEDRLRLLWRDSGDQIVRVLFDRADR